MVLLLLIKAIVILAELAKWAEGRRKAAFNRRFPAIDDEEFIRRCRPGVSRRVARGVRRLIAEQIGVDYYRICPEQSFADLGLD